MDQSAPQAEPQHAEPASASEPSPVQTADRVSSALASLRSELEALQSSMSDQDKRAAELEARETAMRDHAAQLTEREYHLAERHRELNAAQEQLLNDAGTWRRREEEITARERALAERERQTGAPRAIDDTAARLRRDRLKKQRRLLSERAAQLVRAKEALTNRLADTARTRTSLPLAAGAAPAPAPQRIAVTVPQPSRLASFGVGMLCSAFALAAIAGTSWWAAGLVDQPQYSAETSIGMADQVDHADPALSESWTSFHEELARDPQLLEYAAERLKRSGYEEYSTPSDVRRLIEESMTIDASIPGRLNISMLGPGRQRTQRILEAYTSVLVGMANDSRERRADQSSSLILIDAKPGESPVSDHRLPIFGAIAGGLSIACMGVALTGVGLATRMRGSKNKPAVEGDGEEARWSIN